MEELKEEFKRLWPMPARRGEFFTMVPEPQEDFKSFRLCLREIGDTCKLNEMTEEELYIYKYHTTKQDKSLRQHFYYCSNNLQVNIIPTISTDL